MVTHFAWRPLPSNQNLGALYPRKKLWSLLYNRLVRFGLAQWERTVLKIRYFTICVPASLFPHDDRQPALEGLCRRNFFSWFLGVWAWTIIGGVSNLTRSLFFILYLFTYLLIYQYLVYKTFISALRTLLLIRFSQYSSLQSITHICSTLSSLCHTPS